MARAFLCPHCLFFGGVRYACGSCARELDALTLRAACLVAAVCPHCGAAIRWGASPVAEPSAYCVRCRQTCAAGSYHGREVRVLAALLPQHFAELCRAGGIFGWAAEGLSRAFLDDGKRLTCVLGLGALPARRRFVPAAHALRSVEALWIGDLSDAVLQAGQELERLERLLPPGILCARRAVACVAGDRIEPAIEALLAGRFCQTRYGVSAQEFLHGEPLGGGPMP